ncbi:TPA: hypothetical protein ACHKJK_005691, partial [Escherichia coli]
EKQPQIPEGASGMSPERRKSRFPGVLILSVTVGLVMGAVVYGVLMLMTGLDSRITILEGQRREMLSASELAPLRMKLTETEKQLKDMEKRLAVLEQQPVLTASWKEQLENLPEMLEQIESAREKLSLRLDTLSGLVEKMQKVPESPSQPDSRKAGMKKTEEKKPAPVTSSRKSRAVHTVRQAPFVLTGTELRGGSTRAAVAPRGYTSLSQVALLGEGESVAGWTLVYAGHGEATFRVNGRQTV